MSVPTVVLTGAESTGKTTLAHALAAHLGTVWQPEYVRGYVDGLDRPLTYGDVPAIARGQIAEQDRLRQEACGVLICDTDLLSTVLYSRHHYGACPAWVERAAEARRGTLYLFCGADIPWEADPVQRAGPAIRATLQPVFEAALQERGWPYVYITGGHDARLRAAVAAVAALIADAP